MVCPFLGKLFPTQPRTALRGGRIKSLMIARTRVAASASRERQARLVRARAVLDCSLARKRRAALRTWSLGSFCARPPKKRREQNYSGVVACGAFCHAAERIS